jgi:two-component system chemotaxis sensor kinase CheA
LYIIVVGLAEKRLGLVVDTIFGQQEIVIKSVGSLLQGIPGIAGAAELGNRKTILVLDVGALIEEAVSRRATALPLAA